MRSFNQQCLGLAVATFVATVATPASAQTFKMMTPIPPVVATPVRLQTSTGTLHLTDCFLIGIPSR
jgi:hypothetical protein